MKFRIGTFFCLVSLAAFGQTNDVIKVKVAGNRVSLRSAPSLESRVLDRGMQGEEMALLGRTNGWVAVQAPDSLHFWVAGEYVQNGVVLPPKLNVRCGPSQNYGIVCVLNRGDAVTLRGEFNEWLKIAPPAGCPVWISAEYAEIIEPPAPVPLEVPIAELVTKAKEPSVQKVSPTPEEKKPLTLTLDENKAQGEYLEVPGILRRANPGLFKLVLIEGNIEEPICLVKGDERQLEGYLNRALLIKGKQYWAAGVTLPVLFTDIIELDPDLSTY